MTYKHPATTVGWSLLQAADAAAARTAIGAAASVGAPVSNAFAATVGNFSSTSIAVTHNLGTLDVVVSVHLISTGEEVECDIVKTSTNVVTLNFATAPASNSLRCTVIGTAFGAGSISSLASTAIADSTATGRSLITSADAAAARTAIGAGTSNLVRTIQTVTSSTTLGSNGDYIVFIGASGAPILPTAVSNTGKYTFKNVHSADRTVSTTSFQTIDGATTLVIPPGDSVDVVADSVNTCWRII